MFLYSTFPGSLHKHTVTLFLTETAFLNLVFFEIWKGEAQNSLTKMALERRKIFFHSLSLQWHATSTHQASDLAFSQIVRCTVGLLVQLKVAIKLKRMAVVTTRETRLIQRRSRRLLSPSRWERRRAEALQPSIHHSKMNVASRRLAIIAMIRTLECYECGNQDLPNRKPTSEVGHANPTITNFRQSISIVYPNSISKPRSKPGRKTLLVVWVRPVTILESVQY
jgi:hypothetical protein